MESFIKIKESYYDIDNINQDSIHERWHMISIVWKVMESHYNTNQDPNN